MKENFYRKVLSNGMTILFEKRDLPIVSVAFAVRNGGINEKLEEKGISHFIEHMLYKGTAKRNSKKIAEDIEKNGGELNGFTSETITAYWCRMPSKHLNLALDVLSDMIKNPLFDEKELEKERKVIFEEMKMIRDTPQKYVLDKIQHFLYEPDMFLDVIGTEKTLGSIDRDYIVKKFSDVYSPNNLILCIVGNADFENIARFAEDNFSGSKKVIPKLKAVPKNFSEIEKRKGIDQANLVFAYHVPKADDEKSYAAIVLSTLMAEGMSSRLFSEIREKRNLAYAIKGGSEISRDFAYNFIYAGTMEENVETVKRIVLEEFGKVAKDLHEKELNQVKEQIIGNYYLNMEESYSQMINLLFHEIDNKVDDFYRYDSFIKRVKIEDVKELAEKARDNYSFFALVPED